MQFTQSIFSKASVMIALFSSAALLGACSGSTSGDDGDENTRRAEAAFNLKTGISPLPIDLFYAGSADGTLNIPNANNNPAIASVNQLDGWSTTANISVPLTEDIQVSSINPASVIIFKVSTAEVAPGGMALIPPTQGGMNPQPLAYNTDYLAEVSAAEADGVAKSTLLIHPLKPLAPRSGYLVVLTNAMRTPDGEAFQASAAFQLLKDHVDPANIAADRFYKLPGDGDETGNPNQDITPLAIANDFTPGEAATFENIRRLYAGIFGVTDAVGIERQSITLAWTVTTQSISDVLENAQTLADTASKFASIGAVPNGFGGTLNTGNINSALPGIADLYAGVVDLPYYLEPALSSFDPTPLSSRWLADPANFDPNIPGCRYLLTGAPKQASDQLTYCNSEPVLNSTQRVPVLSTIPNNMMRPANGWPVAIFQHGITRNRTDLIAIADALAQVGIAAIAIDHPLHGITDSSNPFFIANSERTFNLDVADNATGAAGPDGITDSSGTHYIQLPSPVTSRDNLRQSAIDIIHLVKTIQNGIDIDPAAANGEDFDANRIYFVGHSLGGITGTTALGINSDTNASVLAMPGGGIAKLLDGSASFGPTIATGLAQQGVIEGTETYESFLRLAQTAADAGDPINYAARANDAHPILMFEVIDDAVVPNNVIDNPQALIDGYLAGTDPLAEDMQLSIVTTNSSDGAGADGLRIFTEGDHSSILNPAASLETTMSMQCEMSVYFATNGQTIAASDCPPSN